MVVSVEAGVNPRIGSVYGGSCRDSKLQCDCTGFRDDPHAGRRRSTKRVPGRNYTHKQMPGHKLSIIFPHCVKTP